MLSVDTTFGEHTTFGLAIAGLDCISSPFGLLSAFVPADGTLFNFLFIISILVILFGCGSGLDLINALPSPSRQRWWQLN